MKFISLFAGIGGFDLGLERAGMECVAQVEIDDFCQRVLQKHWPDVPKFKDVRDVGKRNLPAADLICGGFPCQDVSLAGKRAGLNGKRSTLWSEFYRIVCEIHPRWVAIENVPGLLSSDNGEFFTKILRELSQGGYDAEWHTVSACEFGAPHTRERVFVIAYSPGDRRQGDVSKVVLQERNNLPPETLGFWNGGGHPFSNVQERMGSPGVCRLPDGVPSTLAVRPALRAYGNAVVPQEAEFIGRSIIEIDRQTKR